MAYIGGVLVTALMLVACLAGIVLWYALHVPGPAHKGPLPPLSPEERDIAARLRKHVEAIASVPHNVFHPEELEKAALYIEATLAASGRAPERQVYETEGQPVRNIWITIEPAGSPTSARILVVGAHYDSFDSAPGANDNGTGVAAVLELARLLRELRPANTRIHLVLFANEEPPYFRTKYQGSFQFAELLERRQETVRGMISLETLGAFSDEPGSQRYPSPFHRVFPDVANFIAFVGMPGSRAFLHDAIGAFRHNCAFPTIGGIAPAAVDGIDWSDHASFAERGIPAVMITDTALFRYPHYHQPSDTPDKVDYDKLARITLGLSRAISRLAR